MHFAVPTLDGDLANLRGPPRILGEDLDGVNARRHIDARGRDSASIDAVNHYVGGIGKRSYLKVARSGKMIVVIVGEGHSRYPNRNDQS